MNHIVPDAISQVQQNLLLSAQKLILTIFCDLEMYQKFCE
jgi:hypothetical protein